MLKASNSNKGWPIIGHSKIVEYLQNSLHGDSVAQAYLFVGPAGIGKSTVTKYFINSLVCQNLTKATSAPCQKCEACHQFANNIHSDVLWLEREVSSTTGKIKKNISIEQIRNLQERLSLASFFNSYKVAVINEAETLSLEASNALLKTLEEPTKKTVIILLSKNKAALPLTIISRCQVLNFLPVNEKEIYEHLVSLKIEVAKSKAISAIAWGRPGVAINFVNNKESYIRLIQGFKQFTTLLETDTVSQFKIINDITTSVDIDSLKKILKLWQQAVRDIILLRNDLENLISVHALTDDFKQVAGKYDNRQLINLTGQIDKSIKYLSANLNPKLTLENLVLDF